MLYSFDQLLAQVNSKIDAVSFPVEPLQLYSPIEYALSLGGKRIRPVLALMACNLFKDDTSDAIAPAIGIEIFHNFTLLHDDLMDKADIRRGSPTVHKKWSPNTAILSGDAMQILAYQYVAQCNTDQLPEVLSLFSKTALEVCEGQQFDMDFEERDDVKVEEYLEMIRLKTAVLLACSLKIGAIIGGASPADADLLYRFGEKIGLAFQLKDDLLDTFGDEAKFGKAIGGDISCNKKTFLLIKTLELANEKEREILDKWLHLKDFDRTEKVKAITEIYKRVGVESLCNELIDNYYREAMDALYAVDANVLHKSELIELSEKLMFRES